MPLRQGMGSARSNPEHIVRLSRFILACLAAVLATAGLATAATSPGCVAGRQTGDPLSPPCIPTWSGDNGGSTWSGVTATEIRLVLYNDVGLEGDLNAPWAATDEAVTHFADVDGATTNLVRTAKALVATFNARYQTYGRTLKVTAVRSALGAESSCSVRESEIEQAILTLQPFAIISVGSDMGCAAARAASAGVPTLGSFTLTNEADLSTNGSLVHTFAPTRDQLDVAVGGFLCRSLAGRPARFAGGTLAGAPRTIGLIFPAGAGRPLSSHAAGILGSMANSCGQPLALTRSYRPTATAELVNALTVMAAANITTLVCLCPATNGDARTAIAAAQGRNYLPEWVWSPVTEMDRAMWMRRAPSAAARHIGITPLWLAPAAPEQLAFTAAVAGDDNLDPNPRWTTDLYTALRTAATGIQTAGPLLTPGSVRQGLATVAFNQPANAETVSGAFASPTPSSFTDTFAAWSWDARGETPGEPGPRGCIRFANGGARATATTWPANDLSLAVAGPCTGSLYRSALEESPLVPVRIISP